MTEMPSERNGAPLGAPLEIEALQPPASQPAATNVPGRWHTGHIRGRFGNTCSSSCVNGATWLTGEPAEVWERLTSRWRRRRGGRAELARPPTSRQLSAGTAASQKSSLRPVEPLTSSSARTSSSDGSVGVPPWSMRISIRIWPGFLPITLPSGP